MALNIKSPITDRLAREVAARTGESITEAIQHALELRLAGLDDERAQRCRDVTRLLEELDRHEIIDPRSPDEILGYDAQGLPT